MGAADLSTRASATGRTMIARAPTRIDFGGGWTDVPPYSDEQGGFVCNIAITRYATAVATEDYRANMDAEPVAHGESALANAALQRSRAAAGGKHVSLHLSSDFPMGAGLGGSSAAGVASLGALLALRGEYPGRSEIAELSRAVEVEDLGVPGGRQDHYAAAYGGALGLTFRRDGVDVQRISLAPGHTEKLQRQYILMYTGQSRISGATITAVLDAYRDRNPAVCNALMQMRRLGQEMFELLSQGAIDDLGAAVGEHWIHQRSLNPGITTERIDRIMELASRSGAAGGKAMGASGGGCVLLIAREGETEKLVHAVGELGEMIPFDIDHHGLRISEPALAGDPGLESEK